MPSIACVTLFTFSGFLSCISSPKMVGTICQDNPYLSFSQPHSTSFPPSQSFSHSSSTSCCVSQFTMNEMAGVNWKCGPPFMARNVWPSRKTSPILRIHRMPWAYLVRQWQFRTLSGILPSNNISLFRPSINHPIRKLLLLLLKIKARSTGLITL